MYNLSTLTQSLPNIDHPELVSQGFALWMVWENELPQSVPETLMSFGGWKLSSNQNQSLWVFMSKDVLFACARIFKWFNKEDIRLSMRVFPVKVNIGQGLSHSIGVEDKIFKTTISRPSDFEIHMHARLKEEGLGIHSLKFEAPQSSFMPYLDHWFMFKASESFSFSSSLNWKFILKPAENISKQEVKKKWEKQKQDFLVRFLKIGLKVEDAAQGLIISVDGVRKLRSMALDVLSLLQGLKPGKILSCLLVSQTKFMDKSEFYSDKNKSSLDWSQFNADIMYLPLKNVFQLGKGFELTDEGDSSKERNINELVGVRINKELIGEVDQRLEVHMPEDLVKGDFSGCYYCGLKTHRFQTCPSRNIFNLDSSLEQLERLDIKDIASGLEALAGEIKSGKNIDEILRQSSASSQLLRSIFNINYPSQHRCIRLVWRSRGTHWPQGLRQLVSMEESSIWSALENFRMGQIGFAESSARKAGFRKPKDFQPKTLQGFISLEKEDFREAGNFFDEAAALGYTPLQKAYHAYLKARMKEVEGDFAKAQLLYQEALKLAPGMKEASYRQGVCMVKSGYIDQAMGHFANLIREDPLYFNYVLIDPELEDGHSHLMSSFYPLWKKASKDAESVKNLFPKIQKKIASWFDEEGEASKQFIQHLNFLSGFSNIENYAAMVRIVQGARKLFDDISRKIEEEVLLLRKKQSDISSRLKDIKKQVAWFPLGRLFMRRFNRVSAMVMENLRLASEQDLATAKGYKQSRKLTTQAEEQVASLHKKLSSLKVARDGILFVMLMFRSFLWTMIILMTISIIIVPLITYFGMRHDLAWAGSLVEEKALFFQVGMIVTAIFSLAIASVRTVLSFERKKDVFLSNRK
ncbi:MAG: tetratricopeptide repeat protein [Desulfonatronovibrio sp. MSAO_Bac4]|nr:MAG: tetratricopeptide repeat protein [Desulfonatronovibrio sp. MSAO_Bac4]